MCCHTGASITPRPKGVNAIGLSGKNGVLISMKAVNGDEDCIVVTDTGIVIRISLTQVSTYSRTAQGVKIISVGDTAKVSTVAIVSPDAESDGGAEVQAEALADPDTAE